MPNNIRILAIDPGYERLGVAILEKQQGGKEAVLYSDCFTTSKSMPHSARLLAISKELIRIIGEFKPTKLSVETLFFSKNQKTALLVAEARGVILCAAADNGLEIHEFSPMHIKIAVTGHGASDKQHMMAMIPRLVALTKPIKYDDEYDAIAAGITFFAHYRTVIPKVMQS